MTGGPNGTPPQKARRRRCPPPSVPTRKQPAREQRRRRGGRVGVPAVFGGGSIDRPSTTNPTPPHTTTATAAVPSFSPVPPPLSYARAPHPKRWRRFRCASCAFGLGGGLRGEGREGAVGCEWERGKGGLDGAAWSPQPPPLQIVWAHGGRAIDTTAAIDRWTKGSIECCLCCWPPACLPACPYDARVDRCPESIDWGKKDPRRAHKTNAQKSTQGKKQEAHTAKSKTPPHTTRGVVGAGGSSTASRFPCEDDGFGPTSTWGEEGGVGARPRIRGGYSLWASHLRSIESRQRTDRSIDRRAPHRLVFGRKGGPWHQEPSGRQGPPTCWRSFGDACVRA